jgi:glutathione S-transferase
MSNQRTFLCLIYRPEALAIMPFIDSFSLLESCMEPVFFYGVPQGCSFGSIVALEWLGEPYRLCRINMPQDMRGDLYGRVNPARETPALLLENGATLSESAAILQHLAARGLTQGLGFAQGTAEYDRLNQVLSYLNTSFFSAFSPLWAAYEMEDNPPVQEMLRALGRKEVAKVHAHVEAMLAGREWLSGATRTVADAYFIGIARWAVYHRAVDQRDYPRLYRHVQKLEADPAVRFAHAIEAEQPATGSKAFRGHVPLQELESRLPP